MSILKQRITCTKINASPNIGCFCLGIISKIFVRIIQKIIMYLFNPFPQRWGDYVEKNEGKLLLLLSKTNKNTLD